MGKTMEIKFENKLLQESFSKYEKDDKFTSYELLLDFLSVSDDTVELFKSLLSEKGYTFFCEELLNASIIFDKKNVGAALQKNKKIDVSDILEDFPSVSNNEGNYILSDFHGLLACLTNKQFEASLFLKEYLGEKSFDKLISALQSNIFDKALEFDNEDEEFFKKPSLKKIENVKAKMKNEIIGQDEAIDKIVSNYKAFCMGLKDEKQPHKPVKPLILAGETSVGKTRMCRLLAEYGFDDNICVLNMETYGESGVSKLFGADPSFVGYDDGTELTNFLDYYPNGIIVFDEIEKAHSKVVKSILNLIDTGEFTSPDGMPRDLDGFMIFFTTNMGTEELLKRKTTLGFGMAENDTQKINKDKMKIVKNAFASSGKFPPEFMTRVEIVMCNTLTKEDLRKISDNKFKSMKKAFENDSKKGLELNFHSSVKNYIYNKIDKNEITEARTIDTEIKNLVNESIINNIYEQKQPMKLDVKLTELGIEINKLKLSVEKIKQLTKKKRQNINKQKEEKEKETAFKEKIIKL